MPRGRRLGGSGPDGAVGTTSRSGVVFDSGSPVDSEDEVFEVTFTDPGVIKYFCTPHPQQGMMGAVFVALE